MSDVAAQAAQRAQNPWRLLASVWRGEYPPGSPKKDSLTLVVRLAATPVLILRGLSISTLFRRKSPSFIDGMVLAWTALTSVVLVASGEPLANGSEFLSVVAVVFAWFRIADTISQKLMEILLHSFRPPLLAGVQRSLLLGALNLYEIIACYAILYLQDGGIRSAVSPLVTSTSALYFSTVTALTVGFGDFTPATDGSRALVMSEIATIAVYVVAWFPRIVSLLFPPSDGSKMS